jgi:hypothetical protein
VVNARRAFLGAIGVALAATACEALLGLEDHNFVVDAGVPPSSLDSCHARPPGPPPGVDTSGAHLSFLFGLEEINMTGRMDGGAVYGFDIDGVCTCDPRDETVHDGGPSCIGPANPVRTGGCDYDGGIDNGFATIFADLGNLPNVDTFTSGVSQIVACGKENILISVDGYNGLTDDDNVSVALLVSHGIQDPHDAGEIERPGCGWDAGAAQAPFPARFDGTDRWSVASGTVNERFRIPNHVLKGYVRDFHLVLDWQTLDPGTTIPMVFGGRAVDLHTPTVTARLVPVDELGNALAISADGKIVTAAGLERTAASFRLADGVITGRAGAANLLSSLGSILLRGSNMGFAEEYVCSSRTRPAYEILKDYVCRSLDLTTTPEGDFNGNPCDAFSLSMGFTAAPVLLGGDFDVPVPDGGCGPGFTDSCGNSP